MKRGSMKKWAAVCLAGITILVLTACGGEETGSRNLLNNEEDNEKTVNLFGPMEKTNPDAVNVARSAFDLTIAMAEEEIGRIRAELEESRRSMEQEHRQMVSEMETQYVGVLCDLVKKLTGVLINDKKDVLLHLIRSSISDLKPSGHYTLRVSPEDLTLVENHLDEIQMDMESGISLDVREEKGLEKNECIIETDTQMVDCGFRTQLGNLITTLHMLA